MRLPKTLLILVFVAVIVLSVVYGNNPAVENFANMSAGGIVLIICIIIVVVTIVAFAVKSGEPTAGGGVLASLATMFS